ncbi:hypothetical protein T484DRAFT_3461777 [Baffinella frigidus]|nr:hypothetical protein T484DRAFT_3461777 [Cryptophyta sp. CCMP2293]
MFRDEIGVASCRAKLESWEREEQLRDFYRGSDSKHWVSAGMLAGSLDADGSPAKATNKDGSFVQYKDSWDDSARSELVFQHKAKVGHADFDEAEDSEATWEDKWADWVNDDLEGMTLNTEHFLACCCVKGPVVRMLHLEVTGEVFETSFWAANPRELRAVLEPRLRSRVRVLKPIFKGCGRNQRAIFPLLQKASGGDDAVLNPEATRMVGCNVFGDLFLICRERGRNLRDYRLPEYLEDFVNC